MRLNHFLAKAGVASRRKADEIIKDGRVTVNNVIVKNPATGVSDSDLIELDGSRLKNIEDVAPVYIMLHKPIGYLSTLSPSREKGIPITELLPIPERVFPVGRLDRESSGLILMTNDGEIAHRLMHPSYHVEKEYLVKLHRKLNVKDLEKIIRGCEIDGRMVRIQNVQFAQGGRIAITIQEGRKHIVRNIMKAFNLRVLELKRIRMGALHLGKLAIGRWRKLSPNEIVLLKTEVYNEK